MADSEGHGQHGETERQRYTDEPNTKLRKGSGKDSRSAPAKDQPSRSYKLCDELARHCIALPYSKAQR